MPDMTTSAAADYLADHGYTVRSKRDGTDKAPNSTTIKQWCERGKIKARKSGWAWLISKSDLDQLIAANGTTNGTAEPPATDAPHTRAKKRT